MNKAVLLLAAFMMLPVAQAGVLVSMPDTESTVSDLDKKFRIGLINTGEPVNISLSAENRTMVALNMPEKVKLRGGAEKNPEGSGWYHGEDGKYYPIRYIDVEAQISRGAETRVHRFDILISRKYETSRLRPTVEVVRELNFKLFTTSPKIDTGFSQEELPASKDSKEKQVEKESAEKVENGTKTGDSAGPAGKNSSRPKGSSKDVTILLAVGTLISVSWLIREVLT